MNERIKQLVNRRSTRASVASKKQVKKSIQDLLTSGISSVDPPGQLKGLDKVNQLALEKVAGLQTLATDQLNEIATKFGVSGVESGDPSITIPPPTTNIEDLNLPDIPTDIQSPVKKLTISPVEVKVSEINTISALIGDQFTDQLLPLNFDSLEAPAKEEILQTIKPKAQELALSLINTKPPYCPTPEEGKKILDKYNNLLDVVEKTSLALNATSATLNIITQVVNGSLTAKSALNIAKIAVNQALKIPPLVALPTPTAVTSILTDVEDAVNLITFKADGTPIIKEERTKFENGAF